MKHSERAWMDTVEKVHYHLGRLKKKHPDPPKKRECKIKRKLMHKKKNTVTHTMAIQQKLIPKSFSLSPTIIIYEDTRARYNNKQFYNNKKFFSSIACRTRKRRRKFKCEKFVARAQNQKYCGSCVCNGKNKCEQNKLFGLTANCWKWWKRSHYHCEIENRAKYLAPMFGVRSVLLMVRFKFFALFLIRDTFQFF